MAHLKVKTRSSDDLKKRFKRYRPLYFMVLPAIVLVFIFRYCTAWGSLMAFYDYKPALGFSGSKFVGFKHFIRFFNDSSFWKLMRNTMAISVLRMILMTIFPVIFAVLLNEIKTHWFKSIVQTISYLPHFVSFVVVANIAQTVLANDGPVNNLLMKLGIISTPIVFFALPKAFWGIVSGLNLWQGLGWSSIIYLAAIAGIDPTLYEAAKVDGAGRLKRIWYITLREIIPTMMVLLIMDIPELLKAGFDASYLLGNSMISDYSEVLDTYVYRMGISSGQYSYSTAIGLFTAAVSLILIFSANTVARKYSEYSLF